MNESHIIGNEERPLAECAEIWRRERNAAMNWFPIHDKLNQLLGIDGPVDADPLTQLAIWEKAIVAGVREYKAELDRQMNEAYMRLDYHTADRIAKLLGVKSPIEHERDGT